MSDTSPTSQSPNQPAELRTFFSEAWAIVKFAVVGSLFLIGAVTAGTLALAVISFPYYWYVRDITFFDHIVLFTTQTGMLIEYLLVEQWNDFVDKLYAIIAFLVLIGAIYPFWWLSTVFAGKMLSPQIVNAHSESHYER
jgi:hypothetical protein